MLLERYPNTVCKTYFFYKCNESDFYCVNELTKTLNMYIIYCDIPGI